MNKGITYHILTIVAIFTALGLGIFIGSMLNGEQLMVTQQNRLMQALGENLGVITRENEQLKKDIMQMNKDYDLKDNLVDYLFDDYADDKLKGYNVAVIITGGNMAWSDIQLLLQRAGANIVSVTSVRGLENIEAINTFYQMHLERDNLDDNRAEEAAGDNAIPYVAQNIMHSILTGQYSEFINQMENMRYIDADGDYAGLVDYVIMVGPNENGRKYIEWVDMPMLDVVKKADLPSLIIEQPQADYSAIDLYKKSGFSTIDHIDTIFGKIALLKIMSGTQGHFGLEASAAALIPDLTAADAKENEGKIGESVWRE